MSQYYISVTNTGLAKLAAAQVGGPVVSLTQIAVGDGNGNPVDMTNPAAKTALVHEVYRTSINSLSINSADNTIMMAEMLILSATGGWAIQEIGIFDSTGALFAYGNFPPTYKPIATEGSAIDMIIQAAIKIGNAANVQLVIDTSIVGATRPWVLSTITAAFLIPGGLTGQVLTKASNANGDFTWTNITSAINVVVDAIKEVQTAAAGQTIFTLATITTEGTAVYIEGARQGVFTVLSATQIQLPVALPAGAEVIFVQNEPNEPLNIRRTCIGFGYFMGQLA